MKDKLKFILFKIKAFFVHIWVKLRLFWKQILIVLLLIFLCSCSWFSACQRSSEKSTLSAGADDLTQVIDNENSIDVNNYSFNLFPNVKESFDFTPYEDILTFNNDGSITVNGVVTKSLWVSIGKFDNLPYGRYYFSVAPPFTFTVGSSVSTFMHITETNSTYSIILNLSSGTYDNVIYYPAIIRTDFEHIPPWTPPIYLIESQFKAGGYNDGYDVGYSAGYDVGYNKGYNDGLNVFKYGIFYNANVKTILDNGINQVDFTLPFDYVNGTFTNVYNEIQNNYSSFLGSLQTISLSILPDVSISPNNLDFTLKTFYPENYNDFTIKYLRVAINAGQTNPSFETVRVDFQPVPNIRETFTWSSDILINEYYNNNSDRLYATFTSFDFSISNVDFLNGISLKSSYNAYNRAYDEGYDKGYNEGYNISQESFENQLKAQYDIGRSNGYTNGFNEGYSKGKIEGYNEGRNVSSQGYTFVSLIDAVGYGITKPFASLLNFNLLGVNLLAFMSGLLTLILMIKLVSFFI